MSANAALCPVQLDANLPETFYRGAGRIARFRDAPAPDRPEDWVASTTTRFGQPRSGLSELAPGRLLLDAIADDPVGWLGSTTRPDSGLLVKLLDAGQRLPIHVHPDGEFARSHLARPYGKTEAWIILEAEPDAAVRLGFTRDVASAELDDWVRTQDVAALLAVTNEVPVAAGDALLCPAGLPHAIGAGILLLELQEPTDLSVLLEHEGFAVSTEDAYVGLSRDEALGCVDRRACSPARLAELSNPAPSSLLPAEAARYFRAEPVSAGRLDAGFGVLVVTSGAGTLTGEWGQLPLRRGATVVVPAGAGECTITGDMTGIRCRPAG